MTQAETTSGETTPATHAVVVVHGVGIDQKPGGRLAETTHAVARLVEESGGSVSIDFPKPSDAEASALTMEVKAPTSQGSGIWKIRWQEAFWADAFIPPNSSTVLRWLGKHQLAQIARVIHSLRNPTNRQVDISTLPGEGVSGWKGHVSAIVFIVAQIVLVLAYTAAALASLVFIPVIRILYMLKSIPGAGFFGLTKKVAEGLESLDPFLSKWLGDVQRYMTHRAWSARVRGVAEKAIITALENPQGPPQDLTIIAHSWGAVVAYDAMRTNGCVAKAIEKWREDGNKRVTLVTLGGALNLALSLAEHSNDPHVARFRCQPLDPALTGSGLCPKERRDRFFWLDIHARLDPVPAGGISDRFIRVAELDPIQVKRRQVINEDNPLTDHTTYLENRDLVVPRLLRAVVGGREYPWLSNGSGERDADNARRAAPDISTKTVRERTFRVALMQLGRLAVAAGALAQVLAIALIHDYREWLSDKFGSAIDHVPLLESLIADAADKSDFDRALIFTIWTLIGVALSFMIPAVLRRFLLSGDR